MIFGHHLGYHCTVDKPVITNSEVIPCFSRIPQNAITHTSSQTHMSSDTDDWDHYLNLITVAKAAPEMKAQLMEAVQTLRRILDEDWPSKSKDSYHPILWSLRMISGAMSDGNLINWGGYMSALEKTKNFESLLSKLRHPDKPESAMAELEVAGRLASNGCAVELEPEVGGKRPDMRCRCGDLEFLVEVKTLNTAPESWKATKTLTDVTAACRPIFPSGIIFKTLAEPHLKEVAGVLARETRRAISGMTAVEVGIAGVLKVYLVPNELSDPAKMRAEWHRRQEDAGVMPRGGGMYGPSDNVSQEHRVRTKIDGFARKCQIPPGEPGVLVITGHFLFGDADHAGRFVDRVIEKVYELRNILAVVLVTGNIIGDKEETTITDRRDFVFVRNKIYDYIQEEVVIVKNRFCGFKQDYGHLASLLAAKK